MDAPKTILDLDMKRILSRIEQRYHVRLPRTVQAIDYGDKGDLYVRFRHTEKPEGEATNDGLVIFYYEDGNRIVAAEVLDLTALLG